MELGVLIVQFCLVLFPLVPSTLAQGYPAQEERYADAAPDNFIPSVPWPEWLPSDLSSIPSNLPHAGQWVPVQNGGGAPSQGEAILFVL